MENTMNEIKIETIKGVEGNSIYVDDMRIAGNKPWGGGSLIEKWNTTIENILIAIADRQKRKKRVYKFRYNNNYKVTIERLD